MKLQKKAVQALMGEAPVILAGSVLFSMSLNMFLLPAQVVLGGMTGISTVINIFFGVPIGIMIIILNIPLVVINAFFFGRDFLRRTVIGIAATSAATDIFNSFPITETDPLLCSILGGLSMGAGVGLLISRGYTTGGTDLIACLVKLRWKKVSTGTLVMLCDLVIIIGAAMITDNFNGIFYSVICTWISGQVMDVVLSGERRAAQTFIVTENTERMVSLIFERIGRGVTVLNAVGGYTGEMRRVIMCVVPKRELFFLKQLVADTDRDAFMIVADASEVHGHGFVSRAVGEAYSKNYTIRKK